MTTLKDIFENLAYGELQQAAVGLLLAQDIGPQSDIINMDDPEYIERARNEDKVVRHVNMALTALHTRFWLASREVIIQQYDHIQQYWLDKKYAQTNNLSTEPLRYIMDSIFDPFQDDCLKIEEVHDEGGETLFLNDLTEPWSVFTPTYNSIQVPYPMWCNTLVAHYRANHPKVSLYKDVLIGPFQAKTDKSQKLRPEEVEIFIPEGFMEPLLFYVAHRVFGALNVDNNAEGNNYLQKYEASCQRLEQSGLQITPHYGNEKLDKAGWV